jgi:hypothetical protein
VSLICIAKRVLFRERRALAFIRVFAVLSIVAGLLGFQLASGAGTLPLRIKTSLDKKFPGWRFPLLGPQITGCNPCSALVVHGDFDGDGLPDYAVEIVDLDDLIVFARLGNGRERMLSRSSFPVSGASVDQALDVLPKGERISDGPMYPHDVVVRLDCSGPATATYFSVRGGKWHSDLQVTE